MVIVPINAEANQSFTVQLGGQNCSVNLYQKSTGLFIDLLVDQTVILQTQLCLDRVYLVRYNYLGFIGNLAFMDQEGTDVPYYTGLGSRFILGYFSPDEL